MAAYLELRKNLKVSLLDLDTVLVENSEAVDVLQKITSGEILPLDNLIERLELRNGDDVTTSEFSFDELDDLDSDLFFSWFSHYEYVEVLNELRPLILYTPATDAVTRLVGQVKNCYTFQQ